MSTEITEDKKNWFEKIRKSKQTFDKNDLVREYCTDKKVLDIGCVGQDIDYSNPKWIHNQVKKISKSLVGVDINIEGIEQINQLGYEVYHYDELTVDKKFDVLIMLDVIEHVDNPVDFLNNYKTFLKKDGKIIVSTPNSNRVINFINIFFRNDYSLNYEHTFWFCPKTFLEVVKRTDSLVPIHFYWLKDYNEDKKLTWKGKILYSMDKFLVKFRSNFSPNFMFVLALKK